MLVSYSNNFSHNQGDSFMTSLRRIEIEVPISLEEFVSDHTELPQP